MPDGRAPNFRGRAGSEQANAWQAALKLLAVRARSTHEVRQALARRGHTPDDIATTIARLAAARYLDDADFARNWVLTRARRAAAAPARLARELRAKRIADEEIAAALSVLAEEWDPAAAAGEAARRKLKALQGLPAEVARRRLAAFLERRGFSRDVIRATCRGQVPHAHDTE